MQAHILQSEIVFSLHLHRYFLDRVGLGVAPRLADANRGRRILARFDEIIVRQAHVFVLPDAVLDAAFHRGDMVHSVLLDGYGRHTVLQRDARVVIEKNHAVRQRPVGLDGHFGA